MKRILMILLISVAVTFAVEPEKMTGLPSPKDVFTIAISPHSKELKDYFSPDSLLKSLPKLVPADVQLPAGGKIFWQSGAIVLKDKTVLFWRTCGDWFIAIDTPSGTTFYAFEKKEPPNHPSESTR